MIKSSVMRMIAFLMASMLLSACSNFESVNGAEASNAHTIDEKFSHFFQNAGGEAILGNVISPSFEADHFLYQYTTNVLLVKNNQAPDGEGFGFGPIGPEIGFEQKPGRKIDTAGEVFEDGFIIYKEFIPLYHSLGGKQTLGKPLTGLRFNPIKSRYEQYFEGAGFYRRIDDPPGSVYLLAYGSLKCGQKCSNSVESQSEINPPPPVDGRFQDLVNILGNDFTGMPLTKAYPRDDGSYQQIFENLVLEAKPDKSGGVKLLDLPEILGFIPQDMVAPLNNPDTIFFEISEGEGYNIPARIFKYLDQHFGMQAVGRPIGEYISSGEHTYRQCFQKMCIEEDTRINGAYSIRPSSLGYDYYLIKPPLADFNQGSQPPTNGNANPQSLTGSKEYSIQVWEQYPLLNKGQPQEFRVIVYVDNQVAAAITPNLIVYTPDGNQVNYTMPTTGADGQSLIKIDPIEAPSGTLIAYQVCVNTQAGDSYCTRGDFLIWY